ncbi:hypothetical protein GCM10009733_006850 [Nonomuraea maheshkhaliensis]|uniref:DUF2218 domain-containing protein n=1 Tax=Nonomuraea maheshkhaliensis TaxID=419590 RepID=A0ABN2EPA9_9ACTN
MTAKASPSTPAALTRLSLQHLSELADAVAKGRLQVRLTDMFPPYSLFSVDPDTKHGTAVVEFQNSQAAMDSRPHVVLRKPQDSGWVDYYAAEFELNWARAKRWVPES